MHIVFHIGAHCTGQDALIKTLLKNRDLLAHAGVAVPGPGRYRRILAEVVNKLEGARATPDTQDLLLDTVLDDDSAHRVILSDDSFIAPPAHVLDGGTLYADIGKSAWLRHAFPGAHVSFALTLRNIASFLPALYDHLGGETVNPEEFLQGARPEDLSWADVVHGLRAANPGAPICVWCDEDAPILWPEIMRSLTDLPRSTRLEGETDLARRLLTTDGVNAMRSYLEEAPPETESDRRDVVADFLAGFAIEEAMEQTIALPGWSEALMARLTENYDRDVEDIACMPGVTVLMP